MGGIFRAFEGFWKSLLTGLGLTPVIIGSRGQFLGKGFWEEKGGFSPFQSPYFNSGIKGSPGKFSRVIGLKRQGFFPL